MAKNEDGEFELILGNRQLLSVFFIVVILLGVFFTMGYIVGHNSGPSPVADVAAAKRAKPTPKTPAKKTSPDIARPKKTAEPKNPEPVKQVKTEKPKPVETP